MKLFFLPLIHFIKYLKKKEKENLLIFYSESKFYREHFIDLIKYTKKLKESNIIFATSDYKDYLYHKNILDSLYLGNSFFLHLFFKILKCNCMVMTLTDLGNHLKKSVNCKNYVYFFHSIASIRTRYTKYAFRNYDIVLTNGEYQKKELIEFENTLNFPKKKIINAGYFFLDHLSKKAKLNLENNKNILFAPSWNYNKKNLFDDYGIFIIDCLIKNNFIVTLRPHPEHYKRSSEMIKKILYKFANNDNFFLDKRFSNLDSFEKSSLLITDNSSIDMEYVLLFNKPIIYLDYMPKIHNNEYQLIKSEDIDVEFKKIFGNTLKIEKLKELPELIHKLTNGKRNIATVDQFKKRYLSNIGNSSKFASEYIVSNILNK